ncbi:alpha/beta hydrolase [Fructilactobacillus florum]|uniref:alpha/beta hydrolase n=1 Tax=Fructilactobacillus florum TaxID=640331 RepID=UPI00028C2A82|nr:alpha/beta hydrolase [Fructilactobacillus florum]EKK21012.1 Esterase, lipase [Fructilactobacillus florum 2F]
MERFIDRTQTFVPAETAGINRQFLSLNYAEGERHQLDLYLPNQALEQYPVIIDIYGGGMYFGQRSSQKLNGALQLLRRGFAVVSPDYSLSYMAPFPTPIYELKAVIRWVKAHAASYHLNPRQIFLMGESSGAQLAMVTAASTTAGKLISSFGGNFKYSDQVQGVIASYGPYDLALMKPQFAVLGQTPKFAETGAADSFEGVMLGFQRPDKVLERNAQANPATYFTNNMVPTLLYAGTGDRVVPYLQTINLAAELTAVIGKEKVELRILPDVAHGPAGFMNQAVWDEKTSFLRKHSH